MRSNRAKRALEERNRLINLAHRRARRTGKPVYVVWDSSYDRYDLATEWDLDTYFAGIPDQHVVYCAMPD